MSTRSFPVFLTLFALVVSALGCAPPCPCKLRGGHPKMSRGFQLALGDLLFQDVDCGPMCDAIESVTSGAEGKSFSHVGIVVAVGPGDPMVLEALSQGVVETPLPRFLARSHDALGKPKVWVGRVSGWSTAKRAEAVRRALVYSRSAYDDSFVMGDDRWYCSELVHQAYRDEAGNPIFATEPMTFKTPSGEFAPAWLAYFAKLGLPIPEGQPGINPGLISRSPLVEIVHRYGNPSE